MTDVLFEAPAADPSPSAAGQTTLPGPVVRESAGDTGPGRVPRSLRFVVLGQPAPQGSKRHVGHGVMIESSKKVKPWREAVKYAARLEIDARPGWVPLDGPLYVRMVFSFARPKHHYRTGRNAHLLREGLPGQPIAAPDLSKIARSTEDALTDAGVWVDDARVSEYLRLAKVWVGSELDAIDVPGVRIEVREGIR